MNQNTVKPTQEESNRIAPCELMLGNYITDEWAPKGFWSVSKFTNEKVWYGTFNCRFENARPIPLTGEWLDKFGFEDNSHRTFYKKISEFSFLIVSIDLNCKCGIWENITVADHDLNIECKYVHQLQNLYYALTGLKLKQKGGEA